MSQHISVDIPKMLADEINLTGITSSTLPDSPEGNHCKESVGHCGETSSPKVSTHHCGAMS
jgi:hypothetical protein